MRLLDRIGAYAAHPDPRTALANTVAVVVAGNTPLYPLYLWWVLGAFVPASLLTLCSFPFFLSVPAVARCSALAGRAMLPVVGTANTVFCTWVLGRESATELFLLPCILLGALLFRASERSLMLAALALPFLSYLLIGDHLGPPPQPFTAEQSVAMLKLNALSVGCLVAFIGLLASGRFCDETGP
jgi:hypothetical protein